MLLSDAACEHPSKSVLLQAWPDGNQIVSTSQALGSLWRSILGRSVSVKEIGEWSALGLMTGGLVAMALVASAIQEEVCDTALK